MSLTGNYRFRRGLGGTVVLQVGYSTSFLPAGTRPMPGRFVTEERFRDATAFDLSHPLIWPKLVEPSTRNGV